VQAVEPPADWLVPVPHWVQADRPPVAEKVPAAQLEQLREANDEANSPAVQLVQAVVPAAEIVPGAQAAQAVEPRISE
jgi:hypothetical protein